MDTLARIEYMRTHGSSLIMNWGEDTGVWEVAWITSGRRFCGFSKDLRAAVDQAHTAAADAFKVALR